MNLKRFTEEGIARFASLLDEIRRGEDRDAQLLVNDPSLTQDVTHDSILTVQPFASRFEAGKHFFELFNDIDFGNRDPERDAGLWTWLAALWLDLLAPVTSGRRKLGATARWILDAENYQRYYRHLLAGPYRIYRAHRDDPSRALALLATPVTAPGEVVEQLASRLEIVSNANLMSAVTRLYYDATARKLKRGSGGKGAGSPRRFAKDVLPQFDLTWDFYGMQPTQILGLLPKEFDRFLRSSQ